MRYLIVMPRTGSSRTCHQLTRCKEHLLATLRRVSHHHPPALWIHPRYPALERLLGQERRLTEQLWQVQEGSR